MPSGQSERKHVVVNQEGKVILHKEKKEPFCFDLAQAYYREAGGEGNTRSSVSISQEVGRLSLFGMRVVQDFS